MKTSGALPQVQIDSLDIQGIPGPVVLTLASHTGSPGLNPWGSTARNIWAIVGRLLCRHSGDPDMIHANQSLTCLYMEYMDMPMKHLCPLLDTAKQCLCPKPDNATSCAAFPR